MTDNLQEIVDDIRQTLRATGGAFYSITWPDGRILDFEVIPDGITSILRWELDGGETQELRVHPERLSENLYPLIRWIMRPPPRTLAAKDLPS